MIRVALDGMGGDHAPAAEVEGLALALAELPATFRVQLVGRPDVLEPELAKHPEIDRSRLDVIAAPDVIGMDEKPLQAVRKKPNSSLVVGLALQKEGKSDAYVSAGNTGAVLAASTLMLGLHEGVKRASVATPFPTPDGAVLVLDGGANVDCTAAELVGFARLGTVYMRDILGRAEPAVGLLNVGEEDEKGNAAVREAHALLKQAAGLRYIGNIEGRDILVGHAKWGQIDVVVCDGFVGNVVLKFYESVARLIVRLLKRDAPAILDREDIQKAFKTLDYSEYGGAPLLGVKGVSIIGHGSSGPTAIKNAIRVAVQSVEANLSRHIGEEFARREATASA
ncbi:MAG TPA: phosphate acyltransferase PlsX [Gemmatimonadales bacterium]|nr:phosphate acyltransferase PlsX [Gemmatimonadales bacterium]